MKTDIKTTIKGILNNTQFIITVRTTGRIYIVVLFFNVIFFHTQYLFNIPIFSRPIVLLAFFMSDYNVKNKNLTQKERILSVASAFFLLALAVYSIYDYHH